MARQKKMKLQYSEFSQNFYKKIHDELVARGAKSFKMEELTDELVKASSSKAIVDNFVSQHTPESYKIDQLLQSPTDREEILKLIKDRNYGLSLRDESGGQSTETSI